MCQCQSHANDDPHNCVCDKPKAKGFVVGEVWDDTEGSSWKILSIAGMPPYSVVGQKIANGVVGTFYPDGRQHKDSSYGLVKKQSKKKTIERWIVVNDEGSSWTEMKKPNLERIKIRNVFGVKHITFEVEEGEGL